MLLPSAGKAAVAVGGWLHRRSSNSTVNSLINKILIMKRLVFLVPTNKITDFKKGSSYHPPPRSHILGGCEGNPDHQCSPLFLQQKQ